MDEPKSRDELIDVALRVFGDKDLIKAVCERDKDLMLQCASAILSCAPASVYGQEARVN